MTPSVQHMTVLNLASLHLEVDLEIAQESAIRVVPGEDLELQRVLPLLENEPAEQVARVVTEQRIGLGHVQLLIEVVVDAS